MKETVSDQVENQVGNLVISMLRELFICVITPFPANGSRNNLTFLASAVLLHACVTAIFSLFPNVQNNESLTGDVLLSFLVLVLVFNCNIILLLVVFCQSNLSVKVK